MPVYKKIHTIHVHIPRTAGSSMAFVLENYCRPRFREGENITIREHPYIMEGNHLNLQEMVTCENHINRCHIFDMFVFAFVRNPWDRVVSCWKYQVRTFLEKNWYDHKPDVLTDGSFETFVKDIYKRRENDLNYSHERSQSSYIYLDGNKAVDFIGRFENLEEDWNFVLKSIRDRTNKDISGWLPHNNGVDRSSYPEYYDEQTKGMVEEIYRQDIEEFGYEFGN